MPTDENVQSKPNQQAWTWRGSWVKQHFKVINTLGFCLEINPQGAFDPLDHKLMRCQVRALEPPCPSATAAGWQSRNLAAPASTICLVLSVAVDVFFPPQKMHPP